MKKSVITRLLECDVRGKLGVIGDFCVDVYWDIHPEAGVSSLETGKCTIPVSDARYSPGGAGNIVANLWGLGLDKIPCFGALGSDPFGLWMREELIGKFPEYYPALPVISRQGFHTPVYCKPLLAGEEQSRIDLGDTPMTGEESMAMLDELEKRIGDLSVLIVNGQLVNGIHSPAFRKRFAEIVKRYSKEKRFVFDGRDYLDAYPGVTLKINASAASRLAFGESGHHPQESGETVLKRTGDELVITDGEKGCYVFMHDKTFYIPAISYDGPVDTVGAGDSFTAGFAYALACGESLTTAAEFGTCCSAITIRKLNQTGSPSAEELFALPENAAPRQLG